MAIEKKLNNGHVSVEEKFDRQQGVAIPKEREYFCSWKKRFGDGIAIATPATQTLLQLEEEVRSMTIEKKLNNGYVSVEEKFDRQQGVIRAIPKEREYFCSWKKR